MVALLVACTTDPQPSPTPMPTTFPAAGPEAGSALVERYLDAWAAGEWAAMHAILAPADRERYPLERFVELHAGLAEMAAVEGLISAVGEPVRRVLAPEPRPPDFVPPDPTPAPAASPGDGSPGPSAAASPEPPPAPDPTRPLDGPVPALGLPVEINLESERFGSVRLEREIVLTEGREGWQVRWSPATLFEELGTDGAFRLRRSLGRRGDILAADGTVFATTTEDGVRVYPQEWLAGQLIGYVSPVTAEDLQRLTTGGYAGADIIGRSGLEHGAEELLRGTPGWTLDAVTDAGAEVVLETPMVPGANLVIAIDPPLQATAEAALAPYRDAATAVVDPRSGDVWALASVPAFNPNAATLGTTLDGRGLPEVGFAQVRNKAVLGAYPTGSSHKPFALAAGLKTGVVSPGSLVTCPPTWQYGTFTFRNYLNHTLPGQVGLPEAMAFSCNTTYMPLAFEVYQRDETALTDLLFEFGFGQPTGIRYVVEETGIVPDDDWLRENGRGGFSGFEQVQIAIGQGAFLGTPLQVALAYAAIGNGGTLWTPRLVVRAELPDGTVVVEHGPTPRREISLTPEQLAFVTDTMEAVINLPYGTGFPAFNGFGIQVAGKTGTAETGTPDPHAWFPAFAPADDPTIAVATVLAYIPLGTGGSDAAPLVRRVMAAHFSP